MKTHLENFLNHLKSQSGVGLLEVLVSMIVLGFFVLTLTKFQTENRKGIQHARHRTEALEVAHHVLDSLQNVGISQITTGTLNLGIVDKTETVGRVYTVSAVVTPHDSLESGLVFSKKVTMNVKWLSLNSGDSTSVHLEGVVQ